MNDDAQVLAGLGHIAALLEEIRDGLVHPTGEINDIRQANIAAGGFTDVDLRAWFAGVWIYNPNAFDVYVGFAPGTGTQLRSLLVIGQGAALTFPFRCSLVSVGAASAGTVTIAPLRGPDRLSAGKLH